MNTRGWMDGRISILIGEQGNQAMEKVALLWEPTARGLTQHAPANMHTCANIRKVSATHFAHDMSNEEDL
jgi:hypothetical protein